MGEIMKNRREFLSLMGLFAITFVSDRAIAKGDRKKKKGSDATTCSEKRNEVLKKKCSKDKQSKNQEQCKSNVQIHFEKCLKTGAWEGRKKTIQLEKR